MELPILHIGDDVTQEALETLVQAVRSAGGRALFVGGCVRDAILGISSKDLDIEVYGIAPEKLKQLLGTYFKIDVVGEAFGVLKIYGWPIDVSIPRRESKAGLGHKAFDIFSDPTMTPKDAAIRRDFTVNAMAYDPMTRELIDPFSGFQDLHDHILRHVGEQFSEDPLRVLRGHQFAGRFSLEATPETIRCCQNLVTEYDTLAIERIWGEWYKWAAQSQRPSAGLHFLQQCEWLQKYPELAALQECPQDTRFHPEGDVWIHTLYVVDRAARIAERDGLSLEDRAVLVFSALCHDLGKPETTEVLPDRIRSHGHAGTVETFQHFLQSVGMPLGLRNRVIQLCRYHLTHIDFVGSSKHVRRVAVALDEAGENIEMLARLVEADHSGRPPLPQELPRNMAEMLEVAQKLEIHTQAPKPLLMGRHLLAMNVQAGPLMGVILKAAFEAQLGGEFDTIEGACRWVQQHYFE
ncbi:MAG: multifunctional CCA protein [Nitrospirales bacterium]|nr:MAG: multifunctional CCA protein [Nitrospirales bacterium]